MLFEETLDTALERYQRRVIDSLMGSDRDDDSLIALFEEQIEEWELVADELAELPLGFANGDPATIVAALKGAIQACQILACHA